MSYFSYVYRIQYKKPLSNSNNDQSSIRNLFHLQLSVYERQSAEKALTHDISSEKLMVLLLHVNSGKRVKKMQLTLISEPWLCIRPNSTECFYDLCMQRILVLILRVFQERSQLHFHSFQQLKIEYHTVRLRERHTLTMACITGFK